LIQESKQLRKEKRKSRAAKWKTKKFPQQDEQSRRIVLEKSSGNFLAGKSSNNLPHDSQPCFAASKPVILCASAKQ